MVKRYSPMEDPYVSLLPAWLGLKLCLTHGRRGRATVPTPEQAPLLCLGSLPPLAGRRKGTPVLWGGWLWHQGKRVGGSKQSLWGGMEGALGMFLGQ